MKVKTFPVGPVSANCHVITDEQTGETAVVDCGEFIAELANELKNKDLKYILLTHGHFDHLLGVFDLKQAHPEAKVVIHGGDAPCLTDESKSLAESQAGCEQKYLDADVTVKEGDRLNLGSLAITVMHTPGHTQGCVCYYIESERALFTGDTLFCLTVGRTDLPGGSDSDMYASVSRLNAMEGDYDVYPGHNRSTTMDYERRRNRYMRIFK